MKIKKIKKMKNNKYKMVIDNEIIITFDNVILDNNLLYKKEIDKDLYDLIISDTQYYDVYNKVIKYILKKRRSEKEIKLYLSKFDLNNSDSDKIILKLKKNNLINDAQYCKAYVNDSIYLGKRGINKIKSELLKHDIAIEFIEEELSKVDKNEINGKLEKLIIKKINLNKKYSINYLKHKILNEMIELGFYKEDILKILDINLTDDTCIIKKEFEKIYEKLSKKYEGFELEKHIKNKMLMRGFCVDEINKLLKEKTEE